MTEGDQWFDVSIKLYNEKIAELFYGLAMIVIIIKQKNILEIMWSL